MSVCLINLNCTDYRHVIERGVFFLLELGLSIDSGLHIKRIEPGSIASEDETLSIGDKILVVSEQLCLILLGRYPSL